MATDKTKSEKEYTVEERLKTLYELQTMLSEIDRIKTLRGELPLEVQDLEDEIAGLETRIQNFQTEITNLQAEVAKKKEEIRNSQTLIDKYTAQQDNVRNNREFDFLTKEIEFQNLSIELCEKRIREFTAQESRKKKTSKTARILWLNVGPTCRRKKKNSMKSCRKPVRTKRNCVRKPRNSNSRLSRVCWLLSNAFVKMPVTDWPSFTSNVMPAVVASTRFRHKDNSISRCTRKSSYANIAVAS